METGDYHMNGRTSAYRFTVPNSPCGWLAITMFRVATKKDNKFRGPGVNRKSVTVMGRLGEDNPHAPRYRQGGDLHRYSSQKIKVEHATRLDVYVQEVYGTPR